MKGWLARLRRRRAAAPWQPAGTEAEAAAERARRLYALEREVAGIGKLLRRSARSRGWRRAGQPWWLVLGPARAGKSSWLAASDLPLSRAALLPPAARSALDLWLAPSAALIEVRGQLAEAEPRLFGDFAELLRRRCRRDPCAGIILVISAEELQLLDGPALERWAESWRARLRSLGERFRAESPLHLVVTQLDTLAGCSEFHAQVSSSARRAPCGFTLPARVNDVESECTRRVEPLMERLYAALPARLAGAKSAAERAAGLGYPREFAALASRAGRLLALLARCHDAERPQPAAGVYFCSAAGRSPTVAAPSSSRARPAPLPSTSGHFAAELLRCVLFAERRSVRRPRVQRQRLLRARVAALVAITLGAVLAMLPAISSFRENRSLIEAARAAIARHHSARIAADVGALPPSSLDALLDALVRAESAAAEASIPHWWGAHVASELASALARLYAAELRLCVNGAVREQLLAALRSSTDVARLEADVFEATYADLRLYLMLLRPERLDAGAAAELARIWSRARQRGAYRGEGELLTHAQRFVQALRSHPEWAWREDPALIRRARGALRRIPIAEVAHARLERVARGAAEVRLDDVFVGAASRHVRAPSGLAIPGAYTAAGWQAVRAALDEAAPLVLDGWVLSDDGTSSGPDPGQLRAAYFERYRSAWLSALASLAPVPARTLDTAVDMIEQFAAPEGPLVQLSRRWAQNARLTEANLAASASALITQVRTAPGEVAAASQAPALESPVAEMARWRGVVEFAFGSDPASLEVPPGSGLGQYQEQLRALGLAWQQSAFVDATATLSQLEHAVAGLEASLSQLGQRERMALTRLLKAPLGNLESLLRKRDDEELTSRWRQDVFPVAERLGQSYPFAPRATRDASLEDVALLLAPETGKLWSFVETRLGKHLTSSEHGFELRAGVDGPRLSPRLATCLDAGKELTRALFGEESSRPSFAFSVRLLAPAGLSARLSVDGQATAEGDDALGWQALTWPGDGAAGAALRVQSSRAAEELRREGSFGLLRLLADGKLRRTLDGRTWEAGWQLRRHARNVTLELRAEGDAHPFHRGAFERFACPAQLFEPQGGGAG